MPLIVGNNNQKNVQTTMSKFIEKMLKNYPLTLIYLFLIFMYAQSNLLYWDILLRIAC